MQTYKHNLLGQSLQEGIVQKGILLYSKQKNRIDVCSTMEEKPLVEMFLGGQECYGNVETSARGHFKQRLQEEIVQKEYMLSGTPF
ncbi:MAG: hypothetical protein ACOCZV_00895 [Nanoarchaeota archaeon]